MLGLEDLPLYYFFVRGEKLKLPFYQAKNVLHS